MKGLAAFLGVLAFCSWALAQGGGSAAVEGISLGSRVEVRISPQKNSRVAVAQASSPAETSCFQPRRQVGLLPHARRPVSFSAASEAVPCTPRGCPSGVLFDGSWLAWA